MPALGVSGGTHVRSFSQRTLIAAVLAALVSVFGLSASSGAAPAGPGQGVTPTSVKIGFIYSKTGVASATSGDSDIGCKARVARENVKGVNGRKIQVEYLDDQSSGANLTGAQDLVQNKHVFMVVNNSAFAFLTYRWLLDNNIPVIGGGYDGTYYGLPGNEKIISALGNVLPANGVTYDGLPKLMKKMGATKVAALGYGVSPSSTAAAESLQKFAVPAAGLKAVYTNATKQLQADLKKYAGFTGVPDFGVYTGYITCDMAILGLQNAGNPPTRAAFAPNLRKVGTYDQAGLACRQIDISLETYGQAPP